MDDDDGQRENGRHKQDLFKGVHTQWMIPQYHMKEHHALTMKQMMTIMAERDAAIQERNLALSKEKAALAERDMAILQRNAAIAQRNSVIMERDTAIAAFEYWENPTNDDCPQTCPIGCGVSHGMTHMHHPRYVRNPPHLAEAPYCTGEMHISDAFPVSEDASMAVKHRRAKKELKENRSMSPKRASKPARKSKKRSGDMNKRVTVSKLHEWENGRGMCVNSEDLNKQLVVAKPEWSGQDLGLNQVTFDESIIPVPFCSCTGELQQCYKWGNGGWQSACCTTTLSMHPLPVMPNKRGARVGGRKMSGSAFTKLVSRLAAEGHDLSIPLDLKDRWAKHGTNRYITIK